MQQIRYPRPESEELYEAIQSDYIKIIQVSRISELYAGALHQRGNLNMCLWWCIDSPECVLMVSIAHSAATLCIRFSISASGRPSRITNQTNSVIGEEGKVCSKLTVGVKMGYMNRESSDQWTGAFICVLRSVSVGDLFVGCDKLCSLCSLASVSKSHETGQPNKSFEIPQYTFNWDGPS
jgi:hypothetical protein